jgi:hypothetical protein
MPAGEVMMSSIRSLFRRGTHPLIRTLIAGAAALALALLATDLPVRGVSADLVISQVYGGGGNSGAPYKNDFVELFNRGSAPVSLSGLSVQYASATGTGNFGGNAIAVLSGSLQPGQYYLVQLAGGANGVALPTAAATGTVNMSGTGGKVALVNTTTGLACNGGSTPCTAAELAQIVDLVGWDGANFYESAPASTTSNTTAVIRANGGYTENHRTHKRGAPLGWRTERPLSDMAGGGRESRPAAPPRHSRYSASGRPRSRSRAESPKSRTRPGRTEEYSSRNILWVFVELNNRVNQITKTSGDAYGIMTHSRIRHTATTTGQIVNNAGGRRSKACTSAGVMPAVRPS